MGVEILGTDVTPKQAEPSEGNAKFPTEVDGKPSAEPMKLVSMDGLNVNGKVKEADTLVISDTPKDAVDEWPEAKKSHNFYFVKVRSYDDPELKRKIDEADKELQRKNQDRFRLTEKLKEKRSERSNLKSQLQPFLAEKKKHNEIMDEKRKEMEPLQKGLAEHRTAKNSAREGGMGLCSSEEELDDLIRSLHYRIQHESNTLNEEKQLLKDIKQLEATREKVIANVAVRMKIENSKGQTSELQDKMKLLGVNMDEVRKERKAVVAQIEQIDEKLKVVNDEIASLEEGLRSITEKRDNAYETLNTLRRKRDEVNSCFYQNRSLLNSAREFAAKKDKEQVEALCNSEVEKFMLQWSSNKAFRDDYERRILKSLDIRQLSRDGRMRNPNEKPIVVETPSAAKLETSALKVAPKYVNEVIKPPHSEEAQAQEVNKPAKAGAGRKKNSTEETENAHEYEQTKELSKAKEVDPTKLKEMKREEEIAKAKLAMERKKKLAEKAATKAAARAQKEAEKKLKQKEKKAKKKAGANEPDAPAEETETETKAEEPEEAEAKLENPVAETSVKPKPNINYRNRAKAQNQLPRVILKRKKSRSYIYWAIPAAVLAVVLALVAGFYSFGRTNLRS